MSSSKASEVGVGAALERSGGGKHGSARSKKAHPCFTYIRVRKVTRFVKLSAPTIFQEGAFGSEEWIRSLILFMGESGTRVEVEHVREWMRKYPSAFEPPKRFASVGVQTENILRNEEVQATEEVPQSSSYSSSAANFVHVPSQQSDSAPVQEAVFPVDNVTMEDAMDFFNTGECEALMMGLLRGENDLEDVFMEISDDVRREELA